VAGKIVAIAICDRELESLRLQLLTQWRPIIDRRVLGDFAIGASTLTEATPANIDLRVNISYLTWPAEMPADVIAQLAPEFPAEIERLVQK